MNKEGNIGKKNRLMQYGVLLVSLIIIALSVVSTVTITENDKNELSIDSGLSVKKIDGDIVFASNYASLQAAHDALPQTGGFVYVNKSYVLNETLVLTKGRLIGKTIDNFISAAPGFNTATPLILISETDGHTHNTGLQQLTLNGIAGSDLTLVKVDDSMGAEPYDFFMDYVWFRNNSGIDLHVVDSAGEVRVTNCWFETLNSEGMRVEDYVYWIQNCYFAEDVGINITGLTFVKTICNNVFDGCDRGITFYDDCLYTTIVDNKFQNMVNCCIYFDDNSIISYSTINDNYVNPVGAAEYFMYFNKTYEVVSYSSISNNNFQGKKLMNDFPGRNPFRTNSTCVGNVGHNPYGYYSVNVPSGVGTGNSSYNYFGSDVVIYINGGSEIHIIDTKGVDTNLSVDPDTIILPPMYRIYFDQAACTTWTWYIT